MAIDLYGAAVTLEIADKQGNFQPISHILHYPLYNIQPSVTFLESVSVKISILRLFELEVNLNPPFNEAIALLQTGLLGIGFHTDKSTGTSITVGQSASQSKTKVNLNQMRVQIQYGGKTSRAFRAFLLPPEVEIGLEGVSIKLRGIGTLWSTTKSNQRGTYSGVTRLSIITQLLQQDPNINVQVSNKAQQALSVPEFLNQTKQDHELVQDLLEKSNCIGCEIGADQLDGQLVYQIQHKSETRKNMAAASFVAFRQINPNAGVFPLLSISTSTTNLELPGGAWGKNAYTFDKDSKTTTTQHVGSPTYVQGDSTSPAVTDVVAAGDSTMAGANVDANGNPIAGGGPIGQPSKAGASSIEDKLKGKIHDYMDKVFEYELTSVGIVDLLPGVAINVEVANVSFLTGGYDLWDVTHTISIDGVETKMTAFRTGGLATLTTTGASKIPAVAGKLASVAQRAVKKPISL